MGTHVEWSSPEWVRIPEIISDGEWFLWNTNSRGWTPVPHSTHNRLYFFRNFFFCDNFTKTSEISLKSSKIMVRLEIIAERGRNVITSFIKSGMELLNHSQTLHHWSLIMVRAFDLTLYWMSDCLSILGFMLICESKILYRNNRGGTQVIHILRTYRRYPLPCLYW